jgi:hypothetical protein
MTLLDEAAALSYIQRLDMGVLNRTCQYLKHLGFGGKKSYIDRALAIRATAFSSI